MTRRSLLIASLLLGACAPSPVTVDVNFPTTDAFMRSEQARVLVFPLTQDQLGACPQLLDELPTQSFSIEPVFDSDLTSVCAIRGGMSLPEFEQGPHAYVVEIFSAGNRRILQGCSIGEVYVDGPDVQVQLHPTMDFEAATAAPGTPESFCAAGGS
ncbi:hypothetical protein [Sandaracinus amylolyticus]|uniref:hypothetical protein n=1 Tax=Sandaracinus amylolyticus TaxID=927083 RepID=UPI001F19AEFE|nr:hypothetical protein [Sandaracinus amylolyticus]UJR84773.1 Hypothetical protein I5071_68520 [Sandaracinus amylolyticus]